MAASSNKLSVVICGGGNGAHTLAGIASLRDNVNLTVVDIYQDEAERWTAAMEQNGFCVKYSNGKSLQQEPGKVRFTVTKEFTNVVSKADVLVISVPAFTHEIYLNTVTPHLSDHCLVVGMPGQPGFEYQSLHFMRKYGKKCAIMTTATLPWACRVLEYGQLLEVLGTKDEVEVSLTRQSESSNSAKYFLDIVQQLLGPKPVVKKVEHELQLTLSSRANLHPPIMFSHWKKWDGKEVQTPPLFYQGADEEAVKYLELVSDEVLDIAKEATRRFPRYDFTRTSTMHEWLLDHYSDQIADKTSLLSSLQTNKAYNGLVHPMRKTESGKYMPDFGYRYMAEDVPYGLVTLRAIADLVDVKTPAMDEIIMWAQEVLGREYLVDGKLSHKPGLDCRLPQMYGINSIEELMTFFS